jgi:ABC-2 type transport system permease protein
MLREQTLSEFLKMVRVPIFMISTLVMPTLLFAFFGLPNLHLRLQGIAGGPYLLASFASFSVASVMLFSFGITISYERSTKGDELMRTTALRPEVFLISRALVAMLFGFASVTILVVFGVLVAGIPIGLATYGHLVASALLGSLAFLMMGITVGYYVGYNAAPALINLLYTVLAFMSGMLVPLQNLPQFIQVAARYVPTYHYVELSLAGVGARTPEPVWLYLAALVGYSLLFFVLAAIAYRRESQHRFS